MFRAAKSAMNSHSKFSIEAIEVIPTKGKQILESVHEFTRIKDIRSKLAELLDCKGPDVQLFHMNNPNARKIELDDSQTLRDLRISDSSGKIFYHISNQQMQLGSPFMLNTHISPSPFGTSGVYFLENGNSHSFSAVFKPFDEEQGMINNPKGYQSKPLKEFFKPGQGVLREYAAYLFDVGNFCKVPKTQLVHLEDQSFQYSSRSYPKYGALQDFVSDSEGICEYGSSIFSDFEIQKIALFDLRVLNCDRNDENVLVIKNGSKHELIPIDHAYCFPAQLRIECWDWFWYTYPQVGKPMCPEIVTYIQSIKIEEVLAKLSEEVAFSKHCIFLVRVVHELLLVAIKHKLSLFQIASIVARLDPDIPSPLEKMIAEAESNAYTTIEARSGRLNARHNMESFELRRMRSHSISTSSPVLSHNRLPKVDSLQQLSHSYGGEGCNSQLHASSSFISQLRSPQRPATLDRDISGNSNLSGVTDWEEKPLCENVSQLNLLPSPSNFPPLSGSIMRQKSMHEPPVDGSLLFAFSNSEDDLFPHLNFERDFSRPVSSRDHWEVSVNSQPNYERELNRTISSRDHWEVSVIPQSTTFASLSNDDGDFDHYTTGDHETSSESDDEISKLTKPVIKTSLFIDEVENRRIDNNLKSKSYDELKNAPDLRRMVSFAAPPSAAMYDVNDVEEKSVDVSSNLSPEAVNYNALRVPKSLLNRHLIHESQDFQSLRMDFAINKISFVVKKVSGDSPRITTHR